MQRLRYLKEKHAYLVQLNVLCGRVVSENELSTVEAAKSMREASKKFSSLHEFERIISFQEYKGEYFSNLIKKINELNPCKIAIWTKYTINCGYITIKSIDNVNFKFSEEFADENIFSFSTIDLEDRMLIDFQRDGGKTSVQISLQGKNWFKALI